MFEWKTGDEDWQEENTAVSSSHTRLSAHKWKIAMATAVFMLTGLAVVAFFSWRIDQQVTAVTTSLESQLIDVNQLVLQTAVKQDHELFQSFLSQDGRDWHQDQLRLLDRQLFLNRAPLGLWVDETLPEDGQPQVTLSPDLTQAEVSLNLDYWTLDEAEALQPLTLRHTAVYQKENGAWLLAEPDDAFWGDYVHVERPLLDLITPERDRDIAERLADDLQAVMTELCAEMTDCSSDFVLELRLNTSPESLLYLHSNIRLSTVLLSGREASRFSLPAPTLVGLPQDEAGYAALLRAYSTHMAFALLNALPPADDTTPLLGSFRATPGFRQALAEKGLFTPWPPNYNPLRVDEPPPLPLPEKDILLMCQSSRAPNLFRYDMHDEVWYDVPLQAEGIIVLSRATPMPNGQGVVLALISVTDDSPPLVWVNNGRERTLLTDKSLPTYMTITELEPGRYLFYFSYFDNRVSELDAAILDVANCTDAACELTPFTQEMLPSPDGRYNLITRLDEEKGFIYALGDAAGNVLLEIGTAVNPFWLDEKTLSYLRLRSEGDIWSGQEWVTAVMPEDKAGEILLQIHLTNQDVFEAMTTPEEPTLSYISTVEKHPAQAQSVIVSFMYQPGNYDSVPPVSKHFVYDLAAAELTPLSSLLSEQTATYRGSSPNGGYLQFINTFSQPESIELYDVKADKVHTIPVHDARVAWNELTWSEDEQWVVLADSGSVQIYAPEYNYRKHLFHDLDFCERTAFIEW